MGKENTPNIGIFGRVNAGKSTLMNFIMGAGDAITSPVGGTTTDPVRKRYEISGFSPVVLTDTAGVESATGARDGDRALRSLSAERERRTAEAAAGVDLAVIVFRSWGADEARLVDGFRRREVPLIAVRNLWSGAADKGGVEADISINLASPSEADHAALLELVKARIPERSRLGEKMFSDMLAAGDHVVLVCPIDGGAPSGRIVLPQVQALREVLDAHASAHVAQPGELPALLASLAGAGIVPRMVVADSQVYGQVRAIVPPTLELTTFSILLAAAKGDYGLYAKGLERVRSLRDGDRVLVCEFCRHQISCDDIARVKIPSLMRSFTGRELTFSYLGPNEPMPDDAASHALMLFCGGCMTTRAHVQGRIARVREMNLAATNFGMLLRLLSGK